MLWCAYMFLLIYANVLYHTLVYRVTDVYELRLITI